MPKISSKNQVTLPVGVLRRSGLLSGDEVVVDTDGPGRITVRRSFENFQNALGVFDGLYPPRYLDHVRAGERS